MNNNSKSGFSRFMAGRGFYAALAVCLVGATAAAWITVDRTVSSANDKENVPIEETAVPQKPRYTENSSVFEAKDVAKPKENVKVEETPAPANENVEANEETFRLFGSKQNFVLPVEGKIVKEHSAGELVKYDSLNEWRTHDGIDIEAEVGAEIKAAGDGKVTKVWDDPLWGVSVEIEHGDKVFSVCCGLEKQPKVKVGDEVKAGDVIGVLGDTNLAEVSENSHLHFVMKENGKYLDPKEKLGIK